MSKFVVKIQVNKHYIMEVDDPFIHDADTMIDHYSTMFDEHEEDFYNELTEHSEIEDENVVIDATPVRGSIYGE